MERKYFSKWIIKRKIAKGSYGIVYEIMTDKDGKLEEDVMKVISIPFNASNQGKAKTVTLQRVRDRNHIDLLKKVQQEYQIMQSLSGNDNIVRCYECETIEHTNQKGWDVRIRQEKLLRLKEYFNKKGVISEEDVITLAKNICNALVDCHKKGIIHRDIKPENILVSDEGTYKLGDFGIAEIEEAGRKESEKSKQGTLSYMAPELFFPKQDYDERVDLYSLGMVLYKFFNANRLPFYPFYPKEVSLKDAEEAQRRRLKNETLPDPINARAQIVKVIRKACAFDKNKRYKSASEMLMDLQMIKVRKDVVIYEDGYWIAKHYTEEQNENIRNLKEIGFSFDIDDDITMHMSAINPFVYDTLDLPKDMFDE